MVLAQDFEKATQLLLDMIIVSERFDNELSSEKGVGKVFAKVFTNLTSIVYISIKKRQRNLFFLPKNTISK